MEKLFQLASDIAKLWSNYGVSHYLPGIRNTLILALVATASGCLIGFVCGILNTIQMCIRDRLKSPCPASGGRASKVWMSP